MSLAKKYVYVHECSLAANTPDNFRKVLGRGWVPSTNSGLQYGYEVDPRPMDMTFGPIMNWAHDYFQASEMPAKTQIVSIKPNPYFFPAVESGTVDMGDAGSATTAADPCCGWYAYLGSYFQEHFSQGNPLQILRGVLEARTGDYRAAVESGTIEYYSDRFFPTSSASGSCGVPVDNLTAHELEIPGATVTGPQHVRLYRDLWFQVMTPFSQTEDAYIEGKEKALASDVKFNYNFYLQAYEQQLAGHTLPEIRIPNLYLTLGQDGSVPYVVYLQTNTTCRYKDFAKLVLQNGYKEFLVPIKQQPFLQDKNMYATSFPMDATISFGTDRSTFVADALEDSKMESAMLRRASEGEVLLDASADSLAPYTHSTTKDITPPENTPLDFAYAKRYYSTTPSDMSVNSGPYARALPTFDFYPWLMALPDLPPSVVTLPEDHIFLGNQNDSTDMALQTGLYQHNLSFLANYFILSGKINEIARTHLRTYQQMMRGDTPHSETILYRISKYSSADLSDIALNSMMEGDDPLEDVAGNSGLLTNISENLELVFDQINSGGVSPIQNIWIPNSNTLDVAEYVDTQVKYNKGYVYTVTAYELSVGTEYFYSQYNNIPQPPVTEEICQDSYGITQMTGVLPWEKIAPITEISADESLSQGEIYQAIIDYINEYIMNTTGHPDGTFCDEGTGIGIISHIVERVGEVPDTEYAVYCYCFDDPLPDELVRLGWSKLMSSINTTASEAAGTGSQTGRTTSDTACTIFAQLETNLKMQVSLTDASDSLISALEELGVSSPPSQQYSFLNKSRFTSTSCPDEWTEGAIETFTRTAHTSTPIGGGLLEMVYLGQQQLDAICECPPPAPCSENFLVTTFPSLKIHEVPYMLWTGKVLDSHPVGPDVEINPYRSVNNELLFKLGAGTGDYYDKPIPIFKQDRTAFKQLQAAQKIKDGTVQFRSDDPVQTFEAFMLTERPTRYTDFALGTRRIFSTAVKTRAGQFSDAVSFVEKLEPNKKYYYTFRSSDVHNHMSNPTAIYEIEMVDTDGAIYPLINIYEVTEEMPVDLNRSAQRLIQIRPEYLQSVLDEKGSGLDAAESAGTPNEGPSVTDLKLGIRDEKLWGKKFKLRLTSCETRRMLDINLNFKTEHIVATSDCAIAEGTNPQSDPNRGLQVPNNIPIPGASSAFTPTDTGSPAPATNTGRPQVGGAGTTAQVGGTSTMPTQPTVTNGNTY